MSSLRFIHAADLHLGSSLHLSEEPPEELQEVVKGANFTAFRRIVNSAINYEVDFLLLAGDVYDREERSVKANKFFIEQCQRLKENNIFVYMISGNHDPLNKRKELFRLPDNVIEFGGEKAEENSIEKEGEVLAQVLGQSYLTRYAAEKMHINFSPSRKESFNIGLLHTQLETGNSNYVPCSKGELKEKEEIDYWALGHIHQCQIENPFDPVIAYPGIPQGRDFGEEGLGGCLLVEVDNNQVEYEFIPTSPLVWKSKEVKIDETEESPENLEQLKNLIINKAKEMSSKLPEAPENLKLPGEDRREIFSGYIIRWIVTGRSQLHETLQEQKEEVARELVNSLREEVFSSVFIWTDSLEIKTRAPLSELSELKEEKTPVFSELEELINLCQTEENWKELLQKELGEIWDPAIDHEDSKPEKFRLTDQEFQDILEQAKNLIIEEIIGRRE